ncbi:MAG: OmpH family outer membrane protein [Prevotella sp.]|nr:OmpH family outer membrane protein [Prevotella sp.]MBR6190166.1 OmpH family outer membrane protein [Prevotella sp.]
MKKNILRAMTLVAMATLITSCNNQAPKMDDQPVAAEDGDITSGMNIAFIEIDTLTSQYEFAKQTTLELEKKGTNARNTIQSKTQQLEKNVAAFQQKLQSNGFTSREQAENAQAALQREQNNIVALQQRLEAELANEQQKFLEAFQDSLDHFLTDYNADKKYDLILNKAAILHASRKYDITEEVVNGMNRRYKKDASAKVDTTKTK